MTNYTAEQQAHPCYADLVTEVRALTAHVQALGQLSSALDQRVFALERQQTAPGVMDVPITTEEQADACEAYARRNGGGEAE